MAIRITDDFKCFEVYGRAMASARLSKHAAADGQGAWIVSRYLARLFNRDRAITALMVAELVESGRVDDDPLVIPASTSLSWSITRSPRWPPDASRLIRRR